jgi:Protein of unknown function (DUF2889)
MSEQQPWQIDLPDASAVHVRSIEIAVFEAGSSFELVGRLRDDRPWADGVEKPQHIHDMELRIRVDRSDLVITEAVATMHAFPHAECPGIVPSFEGLVGLSVARGYTRAVQERFGRQLGCSHLEFLARALGPAVIQAMPSAASRHADPERVGEVVKGGGWLTNTCHFWAEGGLGMQKLESGWRPGRGEYPAPSLVEIRARQQRADGD